MFIIYLILAVCFIGGIYYGYSYLRAKSTKTSVVDVITDDVTKK